jgi:hypothetical protein
MIILFFNPFNIFTETKTHFDRDIPIGTICRFIRHIHAITNVKLDPNGKYHIISIDKDIRDRMTHGISTEPIRPKYEAGLVIDLPQLVHDFPDQMVINEIGTLLMNCDIPHKYLKALIIDDDAEYFWN